MLTRRFSNRLKADFCVAALNEAIHKFGSPEVSQFTSIALTSRLKRIGTRISMDRKGLTF